MSIIQEFGLYILTVVSLAILGAYLGFLAHELTHFTLGRVFGSPTEFVIVYRFLPRAVYFPDYETMAAHHIRIAGGTVIFWPVLLIGVIWYFGMPSNHLGELALFFLIGASVVSPSDLLCLFFPEKWRVYADSDDVGHRRALELLFEGFQEI